MNGACSHLWTLVVLLTNKRGPRAQVDSQLTETPLCLQPVRGRAGMTTRHCLLGYVSPHSGAVVVVVVEVVSEHKD